MNEGNAALSRLLHCLALEEVPGARDLYRGDCESRSHGRIFGGQVLAQALIAAGRSVDDRPAHSLQALFLRRGDPARPIDFEVERLRDGRAYSARRIVARQGERVLLTMQASFHRLEPGYQHQSEAPTAAPPESLPTQSEAYEAARARIPERVAGWASEARAFDLRHSVTPSYLGGEPGLETNLAWIRVPSRLPDDPLLHQALLAYASDLSLNDSALRPHTAGPALAISDMSSLDHAMWFHEAARADEWILFPQRSPKAAQGRGFATGEMYTREGRRIATLAQDSMMRPA